MFHQVRRLVAAGARCRQPRLPVILLLMFAAAVMPRPNLAGELVEVDGIPHLRNGSEPANGSETLQLRELWRVGGEDDEILLGRIEQAAADAAGNVYLLDQQLAQVHVYSPAGNYLRALSREGEGPGEVRRPSGMVFMPDGSLGLLQTFPGKIVRVDLEGNPLPTLELGTRRCMLMHAGCAGGQLIVAGTDVHQEPGFQNRHHFLAKIDAEGEETVRYLSRDNRFDFDDFVLDEMQRDFAFWRWAVDESGRVYAAAERNRYAITVMRADGVIERVIERPYNSRRRNEEEMERMRARYNDNARNVPFPVRISVEETDADLPSMRVAADGSLWVLNSRGLRDLPDGIIRTYDVFDPAGHYVKRAALTFADCHSRDRLFFISDQRVIIITSPGAGQDDTEAETEPAPPEIICCAVESADGQESPAAAVAGSR